MIATPSGVLEWTDRLEPLLGKVQKPARYIGCEDGAAIPDHAADKVAWLLAYPDTYEIGLPNQGLQILYEILNERPDAVAERSELQRLAVEEMLIETPHRMREHLRITRLAGGRHLLLAQCR